MVYLENRGKKYKWLMLKYLSKFFLNNKNKDKMYLIISSTMYFSKLLLKVLCQLNTILYYAKLVNKI